MSWIVRPMRLADIEEVIEIERECFSLPWSANAYRHELRENKLAHYFVAAWDNQSGTASPPKDDSPAPAEAIVMSGPVGSVQRAVAGFLRPFTKSAPQAPSPCQETIAGFAGMWVMMDEAHITTIGVRRARRRKGIGELLFTTLMQRARELGASRVTLEVRASNTGAQAMYKKYGMRAEGTRRRYYSDNGEDALIMWSEPLSSPEFESRFTTLVAELRARLAQDSSHPVEAG